MTEPQPPEPSAATTPRIGLLAVLRRTVTEFGRHHGTDLAAALTYYSVLAIFPGLLAIVAVFGLVGDPETSVRTLLNVLEPLTGDEILEQFRPTLLELAATRSAGITFIVGLLAALWSASAYVGAFSRAMNRIYAVPEGRPVWRLRPMQLAVTVVTVLLVVVSLVMLVVSGPIARSVGDVIGLGSTAVAVWDLAKWPVLLLIVTIIVTTLYRATPNVRRPRFQLLSPGALVAILVWIAASVGFAFYVANFGSYNKTYGSLAGVIVALLWLWLTNLALLLGAVLDAELERRRELHAGRAAEDRLTLPMRDDRGVRKAQQKYERTLAAAREVRLAHRTADPVDAQPATSVPAGPAEAGSGTEPTVVLDPEALGADQVAAPDADQPDA